MICDHLPSGMATESAGTSVPRAARAWGCEATRRQTASQRLLKLPHAQRRPCQNSVMYQWGQVSDRDAEEIVCDLLSAEWGVHIERFQAGADGGIDLRVQGGHSGNPSLIGGAIIQVKHYPSATLSRLRSAFRKEVARGIHVNTTYFVVTTASLNVHSKNEIANLFGGFVPSLRIYGKEDLESMLARHPGVEKRHFKLWVGNTSNLQSVLHGRSISRGRQLIQELARDSKYFVETRDVIRAREILQTEGSVIIAGSPGVGKTTVAKMLMGEYISAGWEPIVAVNSVDEAEELITPGVRQIVFYDDFLGASLKAAFLSGKNEDARIIRLLDMVRHSSDLKVILTTREYVLAAAKMDHQRLRERSIDLVRLIMDSSDMTGEERAEVIYRQLYFSNARSILEQPLAASHWAKVIQHRNFNPRLSFFYIDSSSSRREGGHGDLSSESIADGLAASFDDPMELWRVIYDDQLTELQRRILHVLATLRMIVFDDLVTMTALYMEEIRETTSRSSIRQALRAIEGDFIEIVEFLDGPVVSFANASISDYVTFRISSDSDALIGLLRSAVTFSQIEFLWMLVPSIGKERDPESDLALLDLWAYGANGLTFEQTSLAKYECEEVFPVLAGEAIRIFSSGIYEIHPAYGARRRRWEVMPAIGGERRIAIIWDAVKSCGAEGEERIPAALLGLLPTARYSGREEIISHLHFFYDMNDHNQWKEVWESLLARAREILLGAIRDPADLAIAENFAEEFGDLSAEEVDRLQDSLQVQVSELMNEVTGRQGRGSARVLEEDIQNLSAAARWLNVDIESDLAVLNRCVAYEGAPQKMSMGSIDLNREVVSGDYSTTPYRLYPAKISWTEALKAARLLGC